MPMKLNRADFLFSVHRWRIAQEGCLELFAIAKPHSNSLQYEIANTKNGEKLHAISDLDAAIKEFNLLFDQEYGKRSDTEKFLEGNWFKTQNHPSDWPNP